MSRAAVLDGVGRSLEVLELELAQPRAGEIRLRFEASAICHSDVHVIDGVLPGVFPMVLGHEGAGVVTAVGPGVHGRAVGDRVLVTPMPQCGECWFCLHDERHLCERVGSALAKGALLDGSTRWTLHDGRPVHQLSGVGTFAEEAVVSELSVFPIGDDVPFRSAAMMGCRVMTGAGAALNTSDVHKGDSVVVIGCGGVGLSVIQGARIAGATAIIAIDPLRSRLEFARTVGATHTVDADDSDVTSAVRRITGRRGADVVFDVVGATSTLDQALSMIRRGGELVLVGVSSPTAKLQIPAFSKLLVGSTTIKGSWLGSTNFARDVPRLLDHYRSGELFLDELTSQTFPLEDINKAFGAVRQGSGACAVITYS